MCRDKIFNEVAEIVARVTGIRERELMRCNREECTDARWLLYKAMVKMGFGYTEMALMSGHSRQAVGSLLRNERTKWIVQRNWKEICKELENNYLK